MPVNQTRNKIPRPGLVHETVARRYERRMSRIAKGPWDSLFQLKRARTIAKGGGLDRLESRHAKAN
jgi:hypothetical protein